MKNQTPSFFLNNTHCNHVSWGSLCIGCYCTQQMTVNNAHVILTCITITHHLNDQNIIQTHTIIFYLKKNVACPFWYRSLNGRAYLHDIHLRELVLHCEKLQSLHPIWRGKTLEQGLATCSMCAKAGMYTSAKWHKKTGHFNLMAARMSGFCQQQDLGHRYGEDIDI